MTRKHFEVVRHLMTNVDWDYFQFVEIGLDRIQHGFWKYHDPAHRQHEPGSPFETAIRDYYRYLDEEIGTMLELLDDDTIVLVVSDHGAQRLDGGFCVNEWLCREGLLVLHEQPEQATPFSPLDWWTGAGRRVWSEGGYYARVFFNVEGREPNGHRAGRRLRSACSRTMHRAARGAARRSRASRWARRCSGREEIYRDVRNVAPDLIVALRRALLAIDRRRRLRRRCTCRRTTPDPTTATTPSSACSS